VLPGVTVEAASPALIEKVRTAVTDGEGRFNIVALPPGEYSVTFGLAGFNTLKREGIALTAGFSATVNADMQVGTLEETITVTGAAPLVDTQSARQQRGVRRGPPGAADGQTSVLNLIALTPGYTERDGWRPAPAPPLTTDEGDFTASAAVISLRRHASTTTQDLEIRPAAYSTIDG
jgi:hypothetical protein